MSPIYRKILGIYLLVLVLGISLSTLIYTNGSAVFDSTGSLVEEDIPQLTAISRLRVAIMQQKPVLYEYYATTDRAVFLRKFELIQRDVETGLHPIQGVIADKELYEQISKKNDWINKLAEKLDITLNTSPIDWDLARELLVEVSDTENRITPDIDALVELNHQHVQHSGMLAQDKTQLMIRLVIVFSIVIFLIAIFIGYYINAYIAETAERRRLAMFAERNPNPVLRLNWDGGVNYSNPASQTLIEQLGLNQVAELLPKDFSVRLQALRASNRDTCNLEFSLHERVFECLIHTLTDLHSYHVYLEDVTENKQAQQKLLHQAYHDDLTGLPNRRRLSEIFQTVTAGDSQANMAIILLRVDRIKRVLESQGYGASDHLLRALAERLNELMQDSKNSHGLSYLFRLEGATFGMLLPELDSAHQLGLLAERLQASMRDPLQVNTQEFFFTLSIGASIYPLDGRDLENLIRNAEAAVNRVRATGGNAFQCYTQDMNARAQRWLDLENGLRRALQRNEMALYFQPQASISAAQIIGVEALLRWRREDQQFISPVEFIPLAEESGLIIPIGEWVLRTACLQAISWQKTGMGKLVMAVNISARQFQHPGFVGLVGQILKETGLEPQYLELEITESVVMHDVEQTIATLNALRELQVKLSIDDFGTGYSSLSYLKRFPIHKLKVDQSFVRNMTRDANDVAIIKSVIALGQSLNLQVIAEGVETLEQLALLKQFGCDEVQGYLYSRPVPPAEFEQWLHAVTEESFTGTKH